MIVIVVAKYKDLGRVKLGNVGGRVKTCDKAQHQREQLTGAKNAH